MWFTDKGTPNTNGEVMFRSSNDNGTTFGEERINLSNTTDKDLINTEVAEGDNVLVTWRERANAASN